MNYLFLNEKKNLVKNVKDLIYKTAKNVMNVDFFSSLLIWKKQMAFKLSSSVIK